MTRPAAHRGHGAAVREPRLWGVRGDIYTNTAEGFMSLLKRGIVGTFHHVGKCHLGKYVPEFEFRYNARKVADKDRPVLIVADAEGKRLTYKQSVGKTTN